MKNLIVFGLILATLVLACKQSAKLATADPATKTLPAKTSPNGNATTDNNLFIDVHEFGPGKVSFADVMAAHQKDLATEGKYGVNFLKFWFDEKEGNVYCLASAPDSNALIQTHREAHGLVPQRVFPVTSGQEALLNGSNNLFLDMHRLGAGNVTKEAVAGAHQKDLAIEKKYGVNLINYWVDEKDGVVMCLAQASDSTDLIKTHKEAHGLVPDFVMKVKEGK